MKISVLFSLFIIELLYQVNAVQWEQGNWAFACDFKGNDVSNRGSRGEDCGNLCAKTSQCTHFTWTTYNGGTCWMKSGPVRKNNAFDTQDRSMVCGIIGNKDNDDSDDTTKSTNNKPPDVIGVLTTKHSAREQGACELPNADYSVNLPVALGDIASLGVLRFKSDLCGHILQIDCGKGKKNIIITNSNLGGGLDLYASSWDTLTNSLPPGQTSCSAQLTGLNPIKNSGPVCYYIQNEGNNDYYHNVAVFNTKMLITTGATLLGIKGSHRGQNPYYAFDVKASKNDKVTFTFNDGTSISFLLKDCISGKGAKKDWN